MRNRQALLFSARDPAAAFYMIPLVKYAASKSNLDIIITAQEPALSILINKGFDVIPVLQPPAQVGDEQGMLILLDTARRLISETQPDVIIAGLSSRGQGGIDEALLKVRNVPAVLLQDFWGEWNDFFGRLPDTFFVLDKSAAQLTTVRYGVKAEIIGSIRHEPYALLDPLALRCEGRRRLGITDGIVAGWFGQALHHLLAYKDTIHLWSASMADNLLNSFGHDEWHFIYKPHPRETREQIQSTLQVLRQTLGRVHILENWSIEESLAVCDGATSVMSNCLYDAAYLNYHSQEPLIAPVSMLAPESIKETLASYIDFDSLPYESLGIAEIIKQQAKAKDQLRAAHSIEARTRLWRLAREKLNSPQAATELAFSAIIHLCNLSEIASKETSLGIKAT